MSVSIKEENGNPCTTPSAKQQRWRRNFTRVLNVQSQLDPEEMEKVRQRPLRSDLAQKPSLRELTKALGKLKNRKAGGSSNILPEMVNVTMWGSEVCLILPALYGMRAKSQGSGPMPAWSPSLRRAYSRRINFFSWVQDEWHKCQYFWGDWSLIDPGFSLNSLRSKL